MSKIVHIFECYRCSHKQSGIGEQQDRKPEGWVFATLHRKGQPKKVYLCSSCLAVLDIK